MQPAAAASVVAADGHWMGLLFACTTRKQQTANSIGKLVVQAYRFSQGFSRVHCRHGGPCACSADILR